MESTKHFDAIVIGSGQAGNPLVQALANNDMHVAIIERGYLGGSCVNTGCTPTKAYVASARAAWAARNAERVGIAVSGKVTIDMKAVKARKDILVTTPRNSIEQMLTNHKNIQLLRGSAKFTGLRKLNVSGQSYTADKIFINVGTRPHIPKGFETVKAYTNESILDLDYVPDRLIIIGGSYIGLEFAQIFSRFGSQVTLVEMSARLISKEDPKTSDAIALILKAEGIKLELSAECISAKPFGKGVEVQVACNGKPKSIRGTHVLLATGRESNGDSLDLHACGIACDEKGYIQVNESLETNVKNVFALGDCNGHGAFTHTAYNDYEIVSQNLFQQKNRKLSDRVSNYALFIDPPMGRVGLSKNQALRSNLPALYACVEMKDISRAKEKAETFGFMEVIVDKSTELIVGATVLGINGDEVIGTFITAMYANMSYKTLRDSVQTHPTVCELIPSILKKLQPIHSD